MSDLAMGAVIGAAVLLLIQAVIVGVFILLAMRKPEPYGPVMAAARDKDDDLPAVHITDDDLAWLREQA